MLPNNATFNATFTPLLTPTTPASMVLTVTVFVLVFFFLGFFSIFTRHFFSASTTGSTHIHSPLPSLGLSTSTGRYFHPHHDHNHIPAAGLDHAELRALPLLTYTPKDLLLIGCVVCLGEFEEGERVKVIPVCGHVFHPQCIDDWLVLHGSCPICRCSAAGDREVWVNIREIRACEETTSTAANTTTSTTASSAAEDDSDDDDDDDRERQCLFMRLGRSKSFDRRMGQDTLSLRRTFSV